MTTAKGSSRFVTLLPAQFVRPALQDFASQIDGQARAAGIQDGLDMGELVPPAKLETLAQQADPPCWPNEVTSYRSSNRQEEPNNPERIITSNDIHTREVNGGVILPPVPKDAAKQGERPKPKTKIRGSQHERRI